MGERSDRKSPRYRVHLSVRYSQAVDFVTEYAENLSHGGLFVKGAGGLKPLQEVGVEITLPGYGTYEVGAEVAHVLDAETASQIGRSPGVGLAITRRPEGFDQALAAYLQRLGRRADVMVMVDDESSALLLAAAGFQVVEAPAPDQLVAAIAHAEIPVAAVVVGRARQLVYQEAARAAGAGDIVFPMDSPAEFEQLLVRLDAEL